MKQLRPQVGLLQALQELDWGIPTCGFDQVAISINSQKKTRLRHPGIGLDNMKQNKKRLRHLGTGLDNIKQNKHTPAASGHRLRQNQTKQKTPAASRHRLSSIKRSKKRQRHLGIGSFLSTLTRTLVLRATVPANRRRLPRLSTVLAHHTKVPYRPLVPMHRTNVATHLAGPRCVPHANFQTSRSFPNLERCPNRTQQQGEPC